MWLSTQFLRLVSSKNAKVIRMFIMVIALQPSKGILEPVFSFTHFMLNSGVWDWNVVPPLHTLEPPGKPFITSSWQALSLQRARPYFASWFQDVKLSLTVAVWPWYYQMVRHIIFLGLNKQNAEFVCTTCMTQHGCHMRLRRNVFVTSFVKANARYSRRSLRRLRADNFRWEMVAFSWKQ